MLQIRTDQCVTITGIRGSGKSYLLAKLISQTDSYLVYDVMHEHGNSTSLIVKDLNSISFHLLKGHKKIIYRPVKIDIAEFDWICDAVYRTGNRMLFAEEANRVMPNNQITENASKLIDLGRHRNAGLTSITRRIALLDKLPVSQSEHIIVFKTVLPNDVRYLKEFVGKLAEKAPGLKDYKFIYYNGEEVIIHDAI